MEKTIRIRNLDTLDEAAEAAAYREAWSARPIEERIEAVRRLSARLYFLDPNNPPSRRILPIVQIRRDPF
ncbi:MAG: hypothetical protein HKL90_13855 [Elusimicrobia bacterium]|nr:hypothetical protein [Elusimicrobiota bacterium]